MTSLCVLQPHSRRLMDILELFQMKQLIVDPTCTTGNTESLIDIIATNHPDKVKASSMIDSLKISAPREKPKIVQSRNLKNCNVNCFNSHLSQLLRYLAWDQKIQTCYGISLNTFNSVSDIYAPVKTPYAPWLTTDIRCVMNMQDYLKRKAVKNNSKTLNQAYKIKRNEVNK